MSRIGSASVRNGATASSAVSSGPPYMAPTTTIGLPCTASGRNGTGGGGREVDERGELVRHRLGQPAPARHDSDRRFRWEEEQAGHDSRADVVQLELERRDDAEVAAA